MTYYDYAALVRDYLEREWPAAWSSAIHSDEGRRELVRVTLDQFMRGATVPVAAGEAAFALALLS